MNVYFDTTVLVASCVESHIHFRQACEAMNRLTAGATGYISAHGIAEFYAVITRVPFTPPILPNEAWQLLADDILPTFEIVALSGDEYRDAIRHCSENGWGGGRVYDMLHLRSAQKASCDRIYTFNVRHFQQLAPELAHLIGSP